MAYQALARKWRPRNFSEVVGQEHVVKALTHALKNDRLHHAYLFTGTRGVGKTTLARILAKALNCTALSGSDPCSQCPACKEIEAGCYIDLIEVDGASRTKVEDTRDLMDNAQYAPSQGRYKVYIIDEVHMLSGHSFNALLKTLEEPPAHVKFLLATTDPQKIPITVLSRCLQFNLKRLTPEQIRAQMEKILEVEQIAFDQNALRALSRAADGSMRDGLSLLDQAIAHGGGSLQDAEVSNMLGTISRKPVFDLLNALAENDAESLLQRISDLAEHAPNFADALQQLLLILHHAALAQFVPDAIKHDDDAALIMEIATKLSAEDIQLFYQIGLIGQKDLPLAPEMRSGFEMVLLRMLAFRPASQAESKTPPAKPHPIKIHQAKPEEPAQSIQNIRPQQAAPSTAQNKASDWPNLIQSMRLAGITRELANHCVLLSVDENQCIVALDPQSAQIRTQQTEARLEKALQEHFKRPLKLIIKQETTLQDTPAIQIQRQKDEKQQAAELEIEQDETINALKQRFDAKVIQGSIKPLN